MTVRVVAGRRCVVALSGGPDSALAARVCVDHAAATRAVYVHHGLPASDTMQAAATAVAAALGVPITVVRVALDGDSESAARDARRPALLGALGADEWLVTGHTRDDQAETMLDRLIRGTGPEGLVAMRPREGRILRPLLGMRRHEVRAAVADLPFVDDPENAEPRHLRTRLRTGIMPLLVAENPAVVEAITRLSPQLADLAVEPLAFRAADRVARIPLAPLQVAPRSRVAATLRAAITRVRPPHPPGADEVDRCVAVIDGAARRAELAGGITVLRDRTWLRIGPEPAAASAVAIDGLPTHWGGFSFVAGPGSGSPAHARVPLGSVIRSPRPGDRIAITGGRKALADVFAEAAIPPELRPAWPVVEGPDGSVVWVPLLRRAHGSDPVEGGYLEVLAVTEDIW